MLLFLLSGLLLLRFADRQFLALLFQLPPRITRFEPVGQHPKSMQYLPPPRLAAGWQGERHQRLHPLLQVQLRPPPGHPLTFIPAELAGKAQLAPPSQPQPLRKDSIAEKIHAEGRPVQADVWLQHQTQLRREEVLHRLPHAAQVGTALTLNHEVIHVAHVGPAPQLLLDEPVQWGQVEIGNMLGSEVADG